MKDGKQITSDNRITVTRDALQFNTLQSTDNGSYIVSVRNSIDVTNSSLELMVYCKLNISLYCPFKLCVNMSIYRWTNL